MKFKQVFIAVCVMLLISFLLVLSGKSFGKDNRVVADSPILIYFPVIGRQLEYFSRNLSGHSIAAECNPGGGTSCPCSDADVALVSFPDYGQVTSNVRKVNTYVNAIGYKKFIEVFLGGEHIKLGVYSYAGEFSLPILPSPNSNQMENSQAIHMMIQLWDGRNQLYQSNKTTLEGTIYWALNPWSPDYGKVLFYTNPISLTDTGIVLAPDLNWHTFELVVDLATQKYVSIAIDGQKKDLSYYELARVSQPFWGNEVSLAITTESLASWPQASCTSVFTWTTRYRNLIFKKLN